MATVVWMETGEKNNNRKMNKHKSGTEPTSLKIRVQWYQAQKTHGTVTATLNDACRYSCLEKCWYSRLRAY